MKREIKFRAWCKENKNFIYDLTLADMAFTPIGQAVLRFGDIEDMDGRCEHGIDWTLNPNEFELMQFTGLKDKNGKEIYEGDIVSAEDYTGQVFWNEFSCGFRFSKVPDVSIENTHYLNKFAQSQYSVIGNIYENPELLKNK